MTATLLTTGFFFASILIWLAANRIAKYLGEIDKTFGKGQLKRMLGILIGVCPLSVLIICGLVYWVNQPSAQGALTHAIFVIGAAVVGLWGTAMFVVPTRLGLDKPLPALLAAAISLPLALFFLPLDRFEAFFLPQQAGFGLTAGVFGLLVTELVWISLRGSLSNRSIGDSPS